MSSEQKVVIPPRSLARDQLELRLKALAEDEVVSWEALEAATGKARGELYSLAGSVRRALRRGLKMHFRVVAGEGIQRISHDEAAKDLMPAATRQIRGRARAADKLATDIDLEQVKTQEDRLSHVARHTVAKAVVHATNEKTVKRLTGLQSLKPMGPAEAFGLLSERSK